MSVLILIAVVVTLGMFAFSQPKKGEEFSDKRLLVNKVCLYGLGVLAVGSIGYMIYSSTFSVKCEDYDIDTDVYAIQLKTDGHRMLTFTEKIETKIVYGEEADEIMEAVFGKTTKARMLEWNSTPSWAGKYTAKVFYSEEEFDRWQQGLAPKEITRNDPSKGRMYRFTICETGKVYCTMSVPDSRTVYKIGIPRGMTKELFPW